MQQGDRALAAGQDFDPANLSALAYYRRAWEASPGNEDAADGLGIVGERLIAAIDAAIANDDDARVKRNSVHGKRPKMADRASSSTTQVSIRNIRYTR